MSETQTYENGIGITTLASDRGAVENIREDSPVAIHGVLIPENTVLRGGQGVEHFYTPEMAQRAAAVLRDQIDSGDAKVHLVKNFHETEGQAPADDIIGEVTAAGYSPGLGVVFEAETTDLTTANKIKNEYLEVSPSVAHEFGALDEQMQARAVSAVAGFRDVAVVGRGQPGVEVEIGPNPSVEALSMDALSRAFDTLQETAVHTPDFETTTTAEWTAPDLEDFGDDPDMAAVDDHFVVSRTGFPPESFGDLALPVVSPDGALNLNALRNAKARAGQVSGLSGDDLQGAIGVIDGLANDNFEDADFDTESHPGDDGSVQSTDGPADDVPPDDQPQPDHMSDTDTLSDEEQALLAAVDDPSEAIDVLRDYSSREEPEIIDASNRATIDSDELDTLRESVEQAKQAFAALLAEDSPLSVDALARSDMDALTEPFRDDDGAIDIDTLRQTPETGDTGGGDDPDPDDDGVDVDTLSLGERDDLKRQVRKRQSMLNRDMDKRAGEIEAEIVDTLGAESFEDVEPELEAL